jgi:hypothetical protein
VGKPADYEQMGAFENRNWIPKHGIELREGEAGRFATY